MNSVKVTPFQTAPSLHKVAVLTVHKILAISVCLLLLPACATTGKRRVAMGILGGASIGTGGGALLSPNAESRGLNAIVFGLSGALIGGAMAYLSDPAPDDLKQKPTLEEQERARLSGPNMQLYQINSKQELPEFVKQRLAPVVVEEFRQQDQILEDGTLHEPHKVYRILRTPELNAKPSVPLKTDVQGDQNHPTSSAGGAE